MQIDLTIVNKIQGWSFGGAGRMVFISTSDEHKAWEDYPRNVLYDVFHAELGKDVYFSPLAFSADRRSNEAASGFGCLFADLDPVDPRTLAIEPTIAWETSPGMYQAVWRIDQVEAVRPRYEEWADLNKRMTYFTGADKGGWMGSKVLRVPGTWNFKRFDPETGAPRGRVLWDKSEHLMYTWDELQQNVPPLASAVSPGLPKMGTPPALTDEQWRNMIRLWWKDLPGLVQSLLLQPTVRDRSMTIRKALLALLEGGFDAHDAFLVVAGAPWNKFAARPYDLWTEVLKAEATVSRRQG